jgi:hypothetical protein
MDVIVVVAEELFIHRQLYCNDIFDLDRWWDFGLMFNQLYMSK